MADWQRNPFRCPELDLLSLFGYNPLVPRQVAMEKIGNQETTEVEGVELVCETERLALRRRFDEDLKLCLLVPLQIGQMPYDCAHIHCVVFWGGLRVAD